MFRNLVFLFSFFIFFSAGADSVKNTNYGTVFSKDEPMPVRWKQVYLLAQQMPKPEALKFLKTCADSEEWFLQLAALKSYSTLYKSEGLKVARRLIKSAPSLVVRSESVNFLKTHGGLGEVPLFFEALRQTKNFKGKNSLSIRPQLIEAIKTIDVQNNFSKDWSRLRNDSHNKVRAAAVYRSNPLNF